jgi:AraC-like DNA-binding protein
MNVNELEYNTQMKKLELPEYGRHIQRMVDYALTIEDPEERKCCAHIIVRIMGNLFPHLRDVSDFKHKLWDHLAIMSDFKLDIEYPYEIIQQEDLHSRPDKVPYGSKTIKVRHYGHITEELIDKVLEMEEGPEKERLIQLLANHMKKSFLTMNRELVEVAYMVGFNNPSYFSKCFQKQFGMKPFEFVTSHRNKQNTEGSGPVA